MSHLGIINSQIMNECLLVKWIWKIAKGSNNTWYKLLEAKYMPDGNFFNSKCKGTSQFWQGLHKVKHLFKWGAIHKVGDGSLTSFRSDVWFGQSPLKIQFSDLFRICTDPSAMVADCYADIGWLWTDPSAMVVDYYADIGWLINFRRSLSLEENVSWVELLSILKNVNLDQEVRDDVTWALDNPKIFTTKSLYRFITHRGVCIPASEDVWKSKLPLKIKVFMWQLQHNKLQVAASLKNRGWKGDIACCLCGEVESTNHVFFV